MYNTTCICILLKSWLVFLLYLFLSVAISMKPKAAPFSTKPLSSKMAVAYAIISILLASSAAATTKRNSRCYDSIVSFGDSLADTGNLLRLSLLDKLPSAAHPPFGRTFFHHPTGRFSDGRLVIDFIAQGLGLPLVPPYIGGEHGGRNFSKGVNFAVSGATALDYGFYNKLGSNNPVTKVSLGTQLNWFKRFMDTISGGKEYLERSFVMVGEIGGNDYNNPLMKGATTEAVQSLVPAVVDYIGSTIQELIKLGAKTVLVPGDLPIGCMPVYLTLFKTSNTTKDYDPKTGCLNRLNKLARYHNKLLQKGLSRIRKLHPQVHIIYADYYNAAMRLYLSPEKFGFCGKGILRACCGAGGPYNYNASAECGTSPATCCDNPSSFVSWEGIHFTEAFYRLIAQGLIKGPYTTPRITTICPSIFMPAQVHDY